MQTKLTSPLFASFFGLMLLGCSHLDKKDGSSRLKIIEGKTISESQYPAVVKLTLKDQKGEYLGVCTGQFITKETLLTAAHCLDDEAQAFLTPEGQIELGASSFVHPRYMPFDPDSIRFDLALLRFSGYRHPVQLELTTKAPQAGTAVTLVGYGKERFTTQPGAGIGVKRQGQARIHEYGAGVLQLRFSPQSGEAAAAPGDSGGALLLRDGTLAGITSAGAPESGGIIINQYVDLTSTESRDFFRAAAEAGWQLPESLRGARSPAQR